MQNILRGIQNNHNIVLNSLNSVLNKQNVYLFCPPHPSPPSEWLKIILDRVGPFRTKNGVSDPEMGVYRTLKFGCFFSKFKKYSFLLLYYSACKKATSMVFI